MRRRLTWSMCFAAVVALVVACGGGVRNAPRPDSGAASEAELAAAYRRAHEDKDVSQIRKIDLALSMLPEWPPFPGEYRVALEGLFKLDLEQVRVLHGPANAPEGWCIAYLCKKPNGGARVDMILAAQSKLILVGRRPDGARVELDPALGVAAANGRYHIVAMRNVTAEVAQALAAGTAPVCRPIPMGIGGRFLAQTLDMDWGKANRQLDEIEAQIAAG